MLRLYTGLYPCPFAWCRYATLAGMERRIEEERARIEAEYRRVLRTSVEFERSIRNRWRQKCRAKNERIAELEARVAELERRVET